MRSVVSLRDFERLGTTPAGIGVVLAAIGLIVWIGLSIWGGFALSEDGFRLREAWDTSAYFYVGMPVMALAVAMAAFLRPRRAWRWPLWLVGGHQLGVLLIGLGMQSGFSLILLTAMLAILLAAFFTIPAMLGSMAARRLVARIQ
jgi:hypothetical protein